jgi:hypothetical protein
VLEDRSALATPQSGGLLVLLTRGLPPPRQQLADAPCWVVGDAGENIGKPRFRIDVVKASRLNQRIHDRRTLATAVRAAERPILSLMHTFPLKKLCAVVDDVECELWTIEEDGD